jgi:acyl-ACP thioesterase
MEWASLWLLFDLNARKILKPTALPLDTAALLMGDMGAEITPAKVETPADAEAWGIFGSYTHTVRYADTDTNQHMNNAIYGDLVNNAALPSPPLTTDWTELHINYLNETRLDDKITVTARRNENEILIVGETTERKSFTARVVYTNSLAPPCG